MSHRLLSYISKYLHGSSRSSKTNTEMFARPEETVIDILRQAGFLSSPLRLIDVGCSGGYFNLLDSFAPDIEVDAFDPLVREVERLREHASPSIRYHAAFVVSNDLPSISGVSNSFQSRTYAVAYKRAKNINPRKERFNSGADIVYSDQRVCLDKAFDGDDIDFIKVDTDGHDYEVLHGARHMLERKQVLGVAVEVRFAGRQSENANLWRNIDRLLCQNGFSLFDIQIRRYSRADLPSPFVSGPGPTKQGQANWGDALYLRDLGDPCYEEKWDVKYEPGKLAKAIGIFEQMGYPDCALEALNKYRTIFVDVHDRLNLALRRVWTNT